MIMPQPILAAQFRNVVVALLGAAVVVSFAFGEVAEGRGDCCRARAQRRRSAW
jgi:hypothetical protein